MDIIICTQVKYDNKVFEVKLDVSSFKPEDIQVTVNDTDSKLVITGKHQEKPDDHGYISREFNRQIYIPEVKFDIIIRKFNLVTLVLSFDIKVTCAALCDMSGNHNSLIRIFDALFV